MKKQMKNIALSALIFTATVGTAVAQETTTPTTPSEMIAPVSGAIMHPEYVKTIGKMAYVWGWPMVNSFNRRTAITSAPTKGLLGGVVPVAPLSQLTMLNDYVEPKQSFVACPNQDVAYGLGFFSLNKEPVILQVPDMGDRFWVYAIYDARTDQVGHLGKPYGTKEGFYLLVGPDWKGETPKGVTAVIRSSTELANIIPRLFMDDTDKDRKAIKTVVNHVMAYPLAQFDGKMKTTDWSKLPSFPTPDVEGESKWVVPEKFFDQLPVVLDSVRPLPGEEALYASIRQVLEAAEKNPALKQELIDVAVETEKEVITPLFNWKHNGIPAGNGWNRSANNAQWGFDYLMRTSTARSNMYDNRPPKHSTSIQMVTQKGFNLKGVTHIQLLS